MENWVITALAISGITFIGFCATLVRIGGIWKKCNDCNIGALEKKVANLDGKLEIFFSSVSNSVANVMRSQNHLEQDELVDKLNRRALTQDEAHRLATLLQNYIVEEPAGSTDAKRLAASILLARTEQEIMARHEPSQN